MAKILTIIFLFIKFCPYCLTLQRGECQYTSGTKSSLCGIYYLCRCTLFFTYFKFISVLTLSLCPSHCAIVINLASSCVSLCTPGALYIPANAHPDRLATLTAMRFLHAPACCGCGSLLWRRLNTSVTPRIRAIPSLRK